MRGITQIEPRSSPPIIQISPLNLSGPWKNQRFRASSDKPKRLCEKRHLEIELEIACGLGWPKCVSRLISSERILGKALGALASAEVASHPSLTPAQPRPRSY